MASQTVHKLGPAPFRGAVLVASAMASDKAAERHSVFDSAKVENNAKLAAFPETQVLKSSTHDLTRAFRLPPRHLLTVPPQPQSPYNVILQEEGVNTYTFFHSNPPPISFLPGSPSTSPANSRSTSGPRDNKSAEQKSHFHLWSPASGERPQIHSSSIAIVFKSADSRLIWHCSNHRQNQITFGAKLFT